MPSIRLARADLDTPRRSSLLPAVHWSGTAMMSLPPHEFGLNAAGPPPDQQRQPDHASPAADRGRAFELVLIGLVNANRDQNHLTPVQLDDELSRLARIRATQEQGRPLGNLDEIAQV